MAHYTSAHPQTSENTVPGTCILVCSMAAPYVPVEMDLSYLLLSSFPDVQLKFLFFSPKVHGYALCTELGLVSVIAAL